MRETRRPRDVGWIATPASFIIGITDDRLRAAMRTMAGIKYSKSSDGKTGHEWEGKWDWKWFLDKPLLKQGQ